MSVRRDQALWQLLRGRRPIFVAVLACAMIVAPVAGASARRGTGVAAHAPPGANLLRNGSAGVGALSVQGWDSVTIPGWDVLGGLPTVVRYGTAGFPSLAGGRRRGPGRLFAGGAGGPSRLTQTVSLRPPRATPIPAGTRYQLSAWLGGTATSAASVSATFVSGTGRTLGRATIGPVGGDTRAALARRQSSGLAPQGSSAVRIVVHLVTALTNFDGPNAPRVGYNRAVAGQVSFSVTTAVLRPPPLMPSTRHVPRFDHVFLFMFENQDLRSVIGNRKQAPYLNSLLPQGSLLANLYAEEHPSDGNYLALAAGGAFGIPLTDPLEINPRYTVNARNIGDLIGSAHETWRAYLQSAAGPCDDTVHGYYWNDDLPFLYFHDVRDRPAYCATHVVPLEAMTRDLSRPATTPNFAWVGANDCSDMEGCGIRQGDRFLAQELGKIRSSAAWRTQRSLAIITFDEDAYDHEHPAQLVPTIVLGSRAVRVGFVSHVRYTHYSLLRTIEAALGLGTLTHNDLYANSVNDVFAARATAHTVRSPATRRRPRSGRHPPPSALVANSASGTVTPMSLRTGKPDKPIRVGANPVAIAVVAHRHTAYVVNSGGDSVTPVDLTNDKPGRPIRVGADPMAIAVTPDDATAYVVNGGSNTVTPIDTATDRAGAPIRVGLAPRAIAMVRGGRAYVVNWGGSSVTPIDVASDTAGPPIPVGVYPSAIALSPDGRTAYIANYGSNTVTPIATASGKPGRSIPAGQAPNALAVTPDGSRVEVVSGDRDLVTPINTRTGRAAKAIPVGRSPEAVAITPHGATAWVVNTLSGTITPIATRTGTIEHPLSVGLYSYPTTIALAPGRARAIVVDTYAGRATLINTRTRRVLHTAKTGGYPVAAAIAG